MKKKEIKHELETYKEKVRDLKDAIQVLIERPESIAANRVKAIFEFRKEFERQMYFGSRKTTEKPSAGVPKKEWVGVHLNEVSNPFKEAIVENLKERLSKSKSLTSTDTLLSILDDISRMENNH